jgi:hypothetical protein
MTPSQLRLQYLLPKTHNMTSCRFRIHQQLVSFFIFSPRHHALPNVSTFNRGIALCRMMIHSRPQTLLTECVEGNSCRMILSCQFRPTCQFLPVPIFGVNNCMSFCRLAIMVFNWIMDHVLTMIAKLQKINIFFLN